MGYSREGAKVATGVCPVLPLVVHVARGPIQHSTHNEPIFTHASIKGALASSRLVVYSHLPSAYAATGHGGQQEQARRTRVCRGTSWYSPANTLSIASLIHILLKEPHCPSETPPSNRWPPLLSQSQALRPIPSKVHSFYCPTSTQVLTPGKIFPTLQGAINPSEFSRFYVVHRAQSDQCLLDLIKDGKFVLLHGHRMCGKSTRIRLLIEGNSKTFRGI